MATLDDDTLVEIPCVFSEGVLRKRREQNISFVRLLLKKHRCTVDDLSVVLGWKRSTAGAVRTGRLTLERFQEIVDVFDVEDHFVAPSRRETVVSGIVDAMHFLQTSLGITNAYVLDEEAVEYLLKFRRLEAWDNALATPDQRLASLIAGRPVLAELPEKRIARRDRILEQVFAIYEDWIDVFAAVMLELPDSGRRFLSGSSG